MTIAGALVIPAAPVQLPEYVGLADPAAAIRERSIALVREALGHNDIDRVVLVSGHEREPRHTKGAVGIRVARLIVAAAGWTGPIEEIVVPFDARAEEVAQAGADVAAGGRALLVCAADLSAKRTEKAPGHLDERAAGVDAVALAALSAGDAGALVALDADLCAQVWLTGRAALQVLTTLVPEPANPAVLWSEDPYGVLYVLARWHGEQPGLATLGD